MPHTRYRGPPMTLANMRENGESSVGLATALDQPVDAIADRKERKSSASDRPWRAMCFMPAVSIPIPISASVISVS